METGAQSPHPGEQSPPSNGGQDLPKTEGQHPLNIGEQASSTGGQHPLNNGEQASSTGGQHPPYIGEQASSTGGQHPLNNGEQASSTGGQHPPYIGEQASSTGGQHPPYIGEQASSTGGQHPPYIGEQASSTGGQHPPYIGEQASSTGGQHPPYIGEQASSTGGQHPPYIGEQASSTGGQHPPYIGEQASSTGGQHPPYIGEQASSTGGQHPPYIGEQASSTGGQHPPYIGEQHLPNTGGQDLLTTGIEHPPNSGEHPLNTGGQTSLHTTEEPSVRGQAGNVQGGSGYPVLVLLPQSQTNFSLKIKKYFTSKNKSGAGGDCGVTEISPTTYRVHFQDPEARDRVLRREHVIESMSVQVISGELGHSHRSSKTPESEDLYTEDGRRNDYRDPGHPKLPDGDDRSGSHPTDLKTNDPSSAASARDLSPPELFSKISTYLNTDVIPPEILQEIPHKFPYLKVKKSEAGIEVSGSFKEIEKLHKFLEMKLGGGVRRSAHEEEPGEEEGGEDCLNLQTALYEYITEIYKEEVGKIEKRYNVELKEVRRSKGTSYIKLRPLGPEASVEPAKEKFINRVQAVTKDWSQKRAPRSSMKTALEDTKRYMKENHKTLVLVDGDDLILRGPERELTQAVEALQRGEARSLLPRRVITITSKDTKNEVIVDARHMDILKTLKFGELEALQQKYSVRMEEQSRDKNVSVTFKTVNGAPDLGAHACHRFTSLLHGTITNLQRKTITANLGNGERLDEFNKSLRKSGVDVILEPDKGSVTLIASPILLDFAEEKLRQSSKVQDGREAAARGGDTDGAMDTGNPPATKTSAEEEEDKCPICLDHFQNKKVLEKCKHEFCAKCLQQCLDHKPVCPVCTVPYGVVIGNQPDGTMTESVTSSSLPGYPQCGAIHIHYSIPSGTQQNNHPNPGKPFSGTHRSAYLPDNREGREVLRLLKKAFDRKLIFTVGDSRTTGATDTVTWNDIHHKTNIGGGPANFGYPDPNYLNRVRDELKAKGVE